jgi:hypothetical protein
MTRRVMMEGFFVNNFLVKFFDGVGKAPETYMAEIC